MTAAARHEPATRCEPVALTVRDARPADNSALVALASACPMAGDMTMCVDRAPDFFALARLEGERWRVGVADIAGEVVGCVAASERMVYLDGRVARTAYAGDLKVHPVHRGGPAADVLEEYARTACRGFGGNNVLTLSTVLAGNRSMERRTDGRRGLPALTPFAALNVHAIPLLWRRASRIDGLSVSSARDEDVEEMAALWARLAPGRQLAPVIGAEELSAWMHRAPGLAVHDYLVARRTNGHIAGFVGIWDQRCFKQLRVLNYSSRVAAARRAVNAVAAISGRPRLPDPGGVLGSLAAVHLCVDSSETDVLRALLLHAYAERRESGRHVITLALDQRDPLGRALVGLFAQPTVVRAYATTPAGRWLGGPLDGRPLYFESALV